MKSLNNLKEILAKPTPKSWSEWLFSTIAKPIIQSNKIYASTQDSGMFIETLLKVLSEHPNFFADYCYYCDFIHIAKHEGIEYAKIDKILALSENYNQEENFKTYELCKPDGSLTTGTLHYWVVNLIGKAELKRRLREAYKKAQVTVTHGARTPTPKTDSETWTDTGNANRLQKLYGADIRYVNRLNTWRVWTGTHWGDDETEIVQELAKKTIFKVCEEAAKAGNDKLLEFAMRCLSRNKLTSMIALARSIPEIAIRNDVFDRHKLKINFINGTFDLETARLEPHEPMDYITKIVKFNYNPKAKCPKFLDFLNTIMNGNKALIDFLQTAIGYMLTGETNEQCFFIFYGEGANGKTTLLSIIKTLFAAFVLNASADVFTLKKSPSQSGHQEDIARLAGARLVTAIENEVGHAIAEKLMKQITGQDTITASRKFQHAFEFEPTFKIVFAVNHKPRIKGTDLAIWRRVRFIPFTVTIPLAKQVKNLASTLVKEEAEGIIKWCVDGAIRWMKEGLIQPEEVTTATDEYRTSMDSVQLFLDECCNTTNKGSSIKLKELYDVYTSFCEDSGEFYVKKNNFKRILEQKGFTGDTRHGNVLWINGVELGLVG